VVASTVFYARSARNVPAATRLRACSTKCWGNNLCCRWGQSSRKLRFLRRVSRWCCVRPASAHHRARSVREGEIVDNALIRVSFLSSGYSSSQFVSATG
jgi:hypothetical protein